MGDSRRRVTARWRGTRGAAALAVLATLGVLLFGANPAWAHNSLVEASPAKNATLTAAPKAVTLKFLATLKSDGTKLSVTGADGVASVGAVTVTGKTVSAPFTGTAGGAYTVAYEVSSQDGHLVEGSYKFTLAVAESAASSPGPRKQAAQAAPSPTAAASTAPAAAADQQTPWWPWIGGAAVAGLLVGGVINLLKKRRGRA